MGIVMGTTPTLLLTVKDHDLRGASIYVTLRRSAGQMVTKTNGSISVAYSDEDSVLAVRLTQEDTLALRTGDVEVQVRWIDSTGHADATEIKNIELKRVLYEEVISYGG